MIERFAGLDPGVGGGLAVVNAGGGVLQTTKMLETEADLLDWLRAHAWTAGALSEHDGSVKAVLERVRSSPQMGVVSAFTFGRGYGGLRMALVACRIPFDEPTPQQWQKVMGCRTGGDKNVSKRRAQELFPTVKVTHNIADALLLAEFARRCEVRPHEPLPR